MGSDGDVTLSLPAQYRCDTTAPVTVTAPDPSLFTEDQVRLQRLLGLARAALGFECPTLSAIEMTGVVAGRRVYNGVAMKADGWRLVSGPPVATSAPVPSTASNYPPQRVKRVQYLLTELGYRPGPVDGAFGSHTVDAIKRYQADHGLVQTGVPSAELMSQLKASFQARTATTRTETSPPSSPEAAKAPTLANPVGSLVAPAPAGAVPVAGAGQAYATQEMEVEAPASAATVAAQQAGVRVVRGRPLLVKGGWSGTIEREGIASAEEIATLGHFLDHIRIGLNPGIARASDSTGPSGSYSADARALCVANRLLSGAARDEILQPETTKEFRDWKGTGTNEFERLRAKQHFNGLLTGLVTAAPRLPMKFIFVDRLMLRAFDSNQGGFPFLRPIELDLPQSDCFRIGNDYLPVAADLPSLWPMDPLAAEELIQRIPVDPDFPQGLGALRKVFVAVELTLSGARESPIHGKLEDEPLVPIKLDVESVALYEDPDLERHLYTFAVDAPAPSVLLAGLPERIPMPEVAMLNVDTVALLLLKANGDTLSAEAWNVLARHHSLADLRYYDKNRMSSRGTDVTKLASYDPLYVPFFPPGVTLSQNQKLTPQQLELFKAWSLARAKALPARFVLQGDLVRVDGGNDPDRAELRFRQSDYSGRSVLQPLVSRGYRQEQIALPELDKSSDYLAGVNRRRIPLLVFPNLLGKYLPDVTLDQLTTISEGQRWSWPVELDVVVRKTEIVELGQQAGTYGTAAVSDAVVLHLEPSTLRILGRIPNTEQAGSWKLTTLHEQKYDVAPLAVGENVEWDVLGVRLGMTMDEAEVVLRQRMQVARVYDRIKQEATLGHGYAVSRVFIGTDDDEVVALFTAAGNADQVQAVFRRTRMNRANSVESNALYTDADPVYRALTAKYGVGADRSSYYLRWGAADDLSPCTAFRTSDLGTSESTLRAGTASHMDRLLLAQIDFGLSSKVQVTGGGTDKHRPADDWSACGPVVVAHAWGEPMRLWLFDHAVAAQSAERDYQTYVEDRTEQAAKVEAGLDL
ncbi:peptidoglycan-binding domain-containing protein [Zobellella endophytica]|uniref:peptidoglycan-binding domain-containing protein n=1 Tax=Zobellella endophytica TaxID=2116700 RepID=UPI001304C0AB|nr:peptidoglycan-binding protein [Zobellella endophytica]